MRCLVLENDARSRESLNEVLGEKNFEIVEVESIGDLETQWSGSRLDLCVVDLDPDPQSAIDLIVRLRGEDPTCTPIVTSSSADQQVAVRALECGAACFLKKPFLPDEIRLKLSRVIGERDRLFDSRYLLGDLILDRSDLRLKVAERERYLSHLIDSVPIGVISTDREGRILSYNSAAEELYGYEKHEIIGIPFAMLDPDSMGKRVDRGPRRCLHLHKSGERCSVVVQVRQILNELNHHVATMYLVESQAEKDKMEEALIQAERSSVLGQLAPRIAHEFKSPIQVVMGGADIISRIIDGNPEVINYLDRIQAAAGEMRDLVDQMTNLGRPNTLEIEEVQLGERARGVVDSLSPTGLLKYVDLDLDVIGPDRPILASAGQIDQVIRNLVVNAVLALEEARRHSLAIAITSDEDRVKLEVADDGNGIPDDLVDRIFEPFVTRRASGEGTGLGLSIVKTIVDRHHGTIQVDTTPDVGTIFRLSFPVLQS